jgi:hypothetical protein
MVNPAFRIDPLEEPSSSGVSMRLEVAERPRRWYRAMERAKPLVPLARRAPDVVWKVVNRFGFAASKSDSLVRLATAGIDTLVVTDPQESAVYQRGQKRRLRRLGDAGKFSMVVFDPLDHTVFGPLARQRVADALTQHLERKVVGKTALKAATDTVKSRT